MGSDSEDDLIKKLGGSTLGYRPSFMRVLPQVTEYLRRGHTFRAIYEHFKASEDIRFSYDTFLRYAHKHVPNAPSRTRQPSGGSCADTCSDPSADSSDAKPRESRSPRNVNDLWNAIANPNAAKGPYVYGADDD